MWGEVDRGLKPRDLRRAVASAKNGVGVAVMCRWSGVEEAESREETRAGISQGKIQEVLSRKFPSKLAAWSTKGRKYVLRKEGKLLLLCFEEIFM